MKIARTYTLDTEIIEALCKEANASKIINDLLTEYYCKNTGMQKAELKNKLIEITTKIKDLEIHKMEIQNKIAELTAREEKLESTMKEIPEEIIQDFKAFPNMTEDILYIRFKGIYHSKYPELKFNQLLKVLKDSQDAK